MSWLIGKTGYSLFDVWSLVHLAFWFFVGSCLWAFVDISRWTWFFLCVLTALGWEVLERFAEKTWPKLWLNPESWWNSWVSDPIMCMLGLVLAWYALDHWR